MMRLSFGDVLDIQHLMTSQPKICMCMAAGSVADGHVHCIPPLCFDLSVHSQLRTPGLYFIISFSQPLYEMYKWKVRG